MLLTPGREACDAVVGARGTAKSTIRCASFALRSAGSAAVVWTFRRPQGACQGAHSVSGRKHNSYVYLRTRRLSVDFSLSSGGKRSLSSATITPNNKKQNCLTHGPHTEQLLVRARQEHQSIPHCIACDHVCHTSRRSANTTVSFTRAC